MGLFIRLMLKRGTVCQVGRFISRFSEIKHTIWKYFHIKVLFSEGSHYY